MTEPKTPISRTELVALLAMLTATVAFSIDAMLPAIPEIGADLSPDTPNRAQLVIAAFVLGLGFGTFFTGPLSDAFGRRPVAQGDLGSAYECHRLHHDTQRRARRHQGCTQ